MLFPIAVAHSALAVVETHIAVAHVALAVVETHIAVAHSELAVTPAPLAQRPLLLNVPATVNLSAVALVS